MNDDISWRERMYRVDELGKKSQSEGLTEEEWEELREHGEAIDSMVLRVEMIFLLVIVFGVGYGLRVLRE